VSTLNHKSIFAKVYEENRSCAQNSQIQKPFKSGLRSTKVFQDSYHSTEDHKHRIQLHLLLYMSQGLGLPRVIQLGMLVLDMPFHIVVPRNTIAIFSGEFTTRPGGWTEDTIHGLSR